MKQVRNSTKRTYSKLFYKLWAQQATGNCVNLCNIAVGPDNLPNKYLKSMMLSLKNMGSVRIIFFEKLILISQFPQNTNAWYTLKYLFNLIRSSKCERPQTRGQKNPRFNPFAPIVCGVPRCDRHHTPTDFKPESRIWTRKTSQNLSRLENVFIFYCNFRTKNIQGQ